MRHRQAALGHHLHKVAQTELEPKIPANAQDDDFAVEGATLKQYRFCLQLAHRRPQPVQHGSVADPTAPFAPEPDFLTCLYRRPIKVDATVSIGAISNADCSDTG